MNAVWQSIVRNLTPLLIFTLGAALVVGLVYQTTRERIEQNHYEYRLQTLQEVLGTLEFDNDVLDTQLQVEGYGHAEPAYAYIVALGDEPRALILPVLVPDGYSGPISLLMAVEFSSQKILGLRVSEHRETPGLGDKVDVRKSDWIFGFSGRSLNSPLESLWKVRRDGGAFDQFTGATITPRAVVRGVKNALLQFSKQQPQLYALAQRTLTETDSGTAD